MSTQYAELLQDIIDLRDVTQATADDQGHWSDEQVALARDFVDALDVILDRRTDRSRPG